jgi:hypothetical protein
MGLVLATCVHAAPKDYERLPASSEAMIYGAMSRVMLR